MRRLTVFAANTNTCQDLPDYQVGWVKLIVLIVLTSTTSVTSTCLVVMLDSLQAGVQGTMRKLCQGRKKCVALLVISQEEKLEQDPPAEVLDAEQKFSLQTAWLVVKLLPRGYMVRLACSGRSRVWLQYGENILQSNINTKHDLNKHIFQGEFA